MPIDKFLYEVKAPSFHPGPFAIRLKYELKQLVFEKKAGRLFHFAYSTAIFSLLVLCLVFIMKPQTAHNINNLVFRDNDAALDMLLLAEKDIDISDFSSNIRTISTDTSSLHFIEEDKSYLIHKFRNQENKTLIYVSEVKSSQQNKILY